MSKKIRVNITVDSALLEDAKKKLHLFGGKLSTLFNAYLSDFVSSIDKNLNSDKEDLIKKINELEGRLDVIEREKRKTIKK